MFQILIGDSSFLIPSAAVAAAIRDALLAAPQLDCFVTGDGSDSPGRQYVQAANPTDITVEEIDPAEVAQLPDIEFPANVTAVLGEPTASRTRTHRILSLAAADHSRAVADLHHKQN